MSEHAPEPGSFEIREIEPSQAGAIATVRARMIAELEQLPEEALHGYVAACIPILTEWIERGNYRGWLAVAPDGDILGAAGLLIRLMVPRVDDLKTCLARVQNVWVDPHYRRRGIARALVMRAIDAAHEAGITEITLGTSENARPLYESLGFVAVTREMAYRPASARPQL